MTAIDSTLVAALVADQFPQWRSLPVTPVPEQGHDNRTFRLGAELSVRLPSAEGYVAAVAKEHAVLPWLAARLPLPLPIPVAAGEPGRGYPYPWSVRSWLPGTPLSATPEVDRLAADLGEFLAALHQLPAADGPVAGRHSHYRGCHPSVYAEEVGPALDVLGDRVDAARCREVWRAATTTAWPSSPVWFHGDVAAGNLLVRDGRLCAVIDFGGCGVGDPACDLVIAWTRLAGPDRQILRCAVGLDDDTWRRARGWALWKALIHIARGPDPVQERALDAVLADPVV